MRDRCAYGLCRGLATLLDAPSLARKYLILRWKIQDFIGGGTCAMCLGRPLITSMDDACPFRYFGLTIEILRPSCTGDSLRIPLSLSLFNLIKLKKKKKKRPSGGHPLGFGIFSGIFRVCQTPGIPRT